MTRNGVGSKSAICNLKSVICNLQFVIIFLIVGCATAPDMITDSYLKPEIDFSKFERVAVMGFSDAPNAAGSGKEIADIAGLEMLRKGYDVLERNQVEFLLQEQKLGLSGVLDQQTATQVGNILGVKAIVTGTVGTYHREKIYQGGAEINLPGPMEELTRFIIGPRETVRYEVSLTMKMVDIENGAVVWFGSGSLSGNDTSANLAKKIIIKCLKTIPLQKSKKKRG